MRTNKSEIATFLTGISYLNRMLEWDEISLLCKVKHILPLFRNVVWLTVDLRRRAVGAERYYGKGRPLGRRGSCCCWVLHAVNSLLMPPQTLFTCNMASGHKNIFDDCLIILCAFCQTTKTTRTFAPFDAMGTRISIKASKMLCSISSNNANDPSLTASHFVANTLPTTIFLQRYLNEACQL